MNQLKEIRQGDHLGEGKSYYQIVFDFSDDVYPGASSQQISGHMKKHIKGRNIVCFFDIPNTQLNLPKTSPIHVKKGGVQEIRFASKPNNTIRIVMELLPESTIKVLKLSNGGSNSTTIKSRLVIKIINKSKIIVIDPGHGGNDAGAVYPLYATGNHVQIMEKEIALAIAQKVKSLLQSKYLVYMTRDSDAAVSLLQRTRFSDSYNADFFISIHVNSANYHTHSTKGVECHHRSIGSSEEESKFIDILKYKLKDRDIPLRKYFKKSSNWAVLRNGNMNRTAVLFETGFIIDATDRTNLQTAAYQQKLAVAVKASFDDYFVEHAIA